VNLEGLLLACAFHGEAVAGREFGADDDIKGLQIIVGSLGFQGKRRFLAALPGWL